MKALVSQPSESSVTTRRLASPASVRTGTDSAARAWPPIAAWEKRQQDIAAMTFRGLGISPPGMAGERDWASQALDVLGSDSFAEFSVIRSPGRVIWCNFELARRLGFAVPHGDQLTEEFREQLLGTFSFRTLRSGDTIQIQDVVTMYADRYGGEGVRPRLGAARAGFLPHRNLYIKGVGFTPLFRDPGPDDFVHSHGGVSLEDCLSEAVFGEVNDNLFSIGSARVLAIIDQGRYVTAPSGKQVPIALVVRAGAQLRPAHLLGNGPQPSGSLLDKFLRMVRATGQLVTRPPNSRGLMLPDVRATMVRILDDHALTAADGFRWRMIHGALSASNMEMSGAMLDLPTQSTQPRTAPVWLLDYANSVFGVEHIERAVQLIPVYRKLVRNTPPSKRKRFNVKWFDIVKEMERAYSKHIQVRLLCACGLRTDVARRIQAERSQLASRFSDLILSMAALKNPGSVCVARAVVEHVSVLDVYHLLKSFPPLFFGDPGADHAAEILDNLKPVFRGNRFHVAKTRATVHLLVGKFADLYRELMEACADYAIECYGNLSRMQSSIASRAAFENEPVDSLYFSRLLEDLTKAVAEYRSTGNEEIIREAVDQRILASLRSVDGLLAQGESRRMIGGGIELGMRTIAGVNYSVRAWNDEEQTRRLHVSVPVTFDDNRYSSPTVNLHRLTKRQVQLLRYRFTTDGWQSCDEVGGQLRSDERGGLIIDFDDLYTFRSVGRLEGVLEMSDTGNGPRTVASRLGGYTFAIPDKCELISLGGGTADDSRRR